jgi:hypothetical protein
MICARQFFGRMPSIPQRRGVEATMKRLAIATATMCLASAAGAAEKRTINITPNAMVSLFNGLGEISDGSFQSGTNALGQPVIEKVPFQLGVDVRVTISHDKFALKQKVDEFMASVATGVTEAEKNKAASTTKIEIDVVQFSIEDLNLKTNPISASALAAVGELCPTCVGMTSPAPPPPKK